MKWAFIGHNHLDGVEADAAFAAEHGFAGLEYNYWGDFKNLTEETVVAMRAALDRHGVGASAIGLWGWNHMSPDPAVREEAHEMLNRAIRFGGILGADVLITGGGQIDGASLEEQAAQFVKVFPPFLDRAEKAGMSTSMYAVHGNSFFTCLEAYEMVWDDLPQVGIKYDPANWCHHGADYLEVARKHGDKVGYVHIKEHLYIDGDLASQPPAGMGDIAFPKVLAFLYEHGYDGYLSMEPHGPIWSREPFREKMLLISRKVLEPYVM